MDTSITRSPGIAIGGFTVGGGMRGAIKELDDLVQRRGTLA